MSMDSQDLLLISLGPVQDFIASARRCQDLWYGSWLLAEMARTVAAELQGSGEAQLIFPPGLGHDRHAVANKVLARVPAGQARRLADRAELAMRRRLDQLATSAFDSLPPSLGGKVVFHRSHAERHVKSLMEFQWVSVPVGDDDRRARRSAEVALAARKATRDWPAWQGTAGVPKSSLDGARESVLDEALFERPPLLPTEQLRDKYHVKPSERLCGVGLLKRLGIDAQSDDETAPPFHSTSHVAAAPLLVRLGQSAEAQAAFSDWLAALREAKVKVERFRIRSGLLRVAQIPAGLAGEGEGSAVARVWTTNAGPAKGYDGYLLFPSRLDELLSEYSDLGSDPKRLALLRSAQAKLLKALEAGDGPPPYYALLVADGDRMGAAIDALATTDQQRHLAQQVSRFADDCRGLVEGLGGSLVYAGGDDVLALLPLHTALACADRLRRHFVDILAPAVAELPAAARPTLSVGLGIGHHLAPMRETLSLARRAESLAKRKRNSLAILCAKRGGGETQWVQTWGDGSTSGPVADLARWSTWLATGELPHSVAFVLNSELAKLRVLPANWAAMTDEQRAGHWLALHPVALALVRRAWSRRRTRQTSDAVGDDIRQALDAELGNGAAESAASWPEAADLLSAKLQLARLFADAARAAWGAPSAGATAAHGEAA